MQITKQHHCFGGTVSYVEHQADTTQCMMRFTVFVPPQAEQGKCPSLFYLAGLTCTEENFTTKASPYALAAELGLILIAPDTSPRGEGVANDDAYDLGQGAGFYINASQAPWKSHFQMEEYIVQELRELVIERFPVDENKLGIFGHSMGGHGALTLHLKHPDIFKSASAFAPISAPSQCAWGHKAFSAYLGDDKSAWAQHDATELVKIFSGTRRAEILIDQGLCDQFLEDQLHPNLFEAACEQAGHPLTLQRHAGYDHSYFFIQTFMNDHLRHHAEHLNA